jgi:hypothetical protein
VRQRRQRIGYIRCNANVQQIFGGFKYFFAAEILATVRTGPVMHSKLVLLEAARLDEATIAEMAEALQRVSSVLTKGGFGAKLSTARTST